MWLFLIFVAIPIIEIALFIKIGGWLGLFPTLFIIIITAALGTYLVRSQAIATFGNIRQSFKTLANVTEPLVEGAMILFAGALLVTPGFFTDFVGFLLLTPWFRGHIFQYFKGRVQMKTEKFHRKTKNTQNRYSEPGKGSLIIEGEYQEESSKLGSNDE